MMKFILFMISLNMILTYFKNIKFIFLILNLIFIMNFNFIQNYFFLNYYWNNLNYIFAMDNLSFILIMLTNWILTISMIASKYPLNNKFKIMFINFMIMLMNILLISFSSMNMIIFYIFFETSLIPMMIIIMGWGYHIDKIQASMYMIFYTLFGSLPLLMMLMYLYFNMNTLMFNILMIKNNFFKNIYLYMILNSAFFIKLPMYLVHIWLPKAHVEAPISGSMILAGIMLKLGSYGIYRSSIMFPKLFYQFNFYFMIINLMGSLLTSLISLNQTDMKMIVAYSSIVHMNLMLASMMTLYFLSFKGSILMMIAHGLCSSGMFFLVNLNYERTQSRNIMLNKGFINIFPSLSIWWFLLCCSNFAAPPSLNLFSEIMLINSLIQWNLYFMILIFFISFFSTCYSIFLYSFTQYSKFNFSLMNFKFINCREYLIIILHWLPLNLFWLNLNLFYLKLNLNKFK